MLVGFILGIYLMLLLFTASSFCQRWMTVEASLLLSKELKTKVQVGHARLGLFNRVVLDDILLLDQESDTLFTAARLSAKIDLLPLVQGKIRIGNIQLFGFDINLRKREHSDAYNFQFLADYFASEDTTKTALDLAIREVIIRRGTLSHNIDSVPLSDHFSPAHLNLTDFNLRMSLRAITNDSISLSINRLKFIESSSGLIVDNLRTSLDAGPLGSLLTGFLLEMPGTSLRIPRITLKGAIDNLAENDLAFQVAGKVTPADFSAFVPALAPFKQSLRVSLAADKRARVVNIKKCYFDADDFMLDVLADAQLNIEDTTLLIPFDEVHADLKRLHLHPSFLQSTLKALGPSYGKLLSDSVVHKLTRLGEIKVNGYLDGAQHLNLTQANLALSTSLGSVLLKGSLDHQDAFTLSAQTNSFQLAKLMHANEDFPIDDITLDSNFKGSVKKKMVHGTLNFNNLMAFGKSIDLVECDATLSPRLLKGKVNVNDNQYAVDLNTFIQSDRDIQFTLQGLERMQGFVSLRNVTIADGDKNFDMNHLQLAVNNDDKGHHLLLQGDMIDAHVDGRFQYQNLVPTVQQFLHRALPSLVDAPKTQVFDNDDQMNLLVHLWDANELFKLLGLDLQMKEQWNCMGHINNRDQSMELLADLPDLTYGSEQLRSLGLIFRQREDSLSTYLALRRVMEEGPVDLTLYLKGGNDELQSFIEWDDHNQPSQRGELSAISRFYTDEAQKLGCDIDIQPGQIVVSDTLWDVHASKIRFHDQLIDVNHFEVSQQGRHLKVNGCVSKNPADTLYADLRGINLQYVFGIIDFHDVEFGGLATGKMKVHDIYDDIAVDANLEVHDFTLNDGLLGELYVVGGFGRKDDHAIDLDALIREPERNEISHVTALIKPGHEPGRGMELDVQARRLNTYFINSFTDGILSDVRGSASGHVRLSGPFKALDLDGHVVLDTMAMTVDVLNTRYHVLPGDTVLLSPEGIHFQNIHVYDSHHGRDNRAHSAVLNGDLFFRHFENLRFSFDVSAQEFLGYDFREFGDQSFYGTVYATGSVNLSGNPGSVLVDLRCRPTAGTTFVYNASSPEVMTDNAFVTFVSPKQKRKREAQAMIDDGDYEEEEEESATDIRINFDLDVTPQAQMRILMDARTEDYITLYGDGHIRADFYNKGRFNMYGNYRVDRGTYKLSLQEVIRKEFRFQKGSTITFGGDPMKGDLNLQAIYTVPSVSLNDLAAGTNFSNSNVRVNCLMNITGHPTQPRIAFDFDIPNVNEDEKQMVRSLISTDEERNMQVIYLLGIGRFYTYGLDTGQSQANAAMQSLLSSTLSGQLNELLSTMIGNGNWNFGTNLSTGNKGWNEVDVEGMLSGRLLNNRLLINGTFGYRDRPTANTNFIGDFDVQWLLNPSGTIRLKAYSETNDRYFTKSALTTQGVGIQVNKDFNTLGELFRVRKKRTTTITQ